jgi:hypothetical protein
MNCRQFRSLLAESELPDLEQAMAPPAMAAHVRDCPACATLLKRHGDLRAGLRRMAVLQAECAAPGRVELTLLGELRAQAQLPQRTLAIARRVGAGALAPLPAGILSAGALAAALAALLLWSHPPGSRTLPAPTAAAVSVVDDTAAVESDFTPLPYFSNSGLQSGPDADADVVRVEVPRSTLVAWGVPGAEDETADAVQAELLLGAGGVPQAVRLLE